MKNKKKKKKKTYPRKARVSLEGIPGAIRGTVRRAAVGPRGLEERTVLAELLLQLLEQLVPGFTPETLPETRFLAIEVRHLFHHVVLCFLPMEYMYI